MLRLDTNAFSGMTDFSQLPESMTHLDVSNTQISGELFLDEQLTENFFVHNSKVIQKSRESK